MAPEPAASVLVVDDEGGVRDLMSRWLTSGGLSVTTAASADEALGHLAVRPPAVALCDIRMPGHDGMWLAERIRRSSPETAVIIATGVYDIGLAIDSLSQGVVDYLTKPFGRERLREAIARGLEWHRAAWDARRWRDTLEEELQARRARLASVMAMMRVDSEEAVDTMLAMATVADLDAREHAHRVSDLALRLAAALRMTSDAISPLRHAALLHDIGKLAIPDAVVRKPAPLTGDEVAIMRRYPLIGSELVAAVPYLAGAARLIADACERPDGRGYPRGAAATDVPAGARLIAVADAFDAMTHPRVYRDPLPVCDALLELERCRGSQFDASCVDALLALARPPS